MASNPSLELPLRASLCFHRQLLGGDGWGSLDVHPQRVKFQLGPAAPVLQRGRAAGRLPDRHRAAHPGGLSGPPADPKPPERAVAASSLRRPTHLL